MIRRPELEGLAFERFEDADRSGKETSKRPGYLALMDRIRTAPAGHIGAIAFYDADRLHRNDVEFFRFMAEMTERRILVLDANGLISNVDRLSWKIKAIVAQEERDKVSRRVRDNLRFRRRNGQLLGTIPQGYRRVDGQIVEDPDSAPAIKEIFRLYATGRFSLRLLAEHLNRYGVRPNRGDGKANHNRAKAIIFTADVLKDLIGNPSYAGKVLVDGELVQGLRPALVDEETSRAYQEVKRRNVRRTSKAWTKHTYPLTPILLCARCGGPLSICEGGRKQGNAELAAKFAAKMSAARRPANTEVVRKSFGSRFGAADSDYIDVDCLGMKRGRPTNAPSADLRRWSGDGRKVERRRSEGEIGR